MSDTTETRLEAAFSAEAHRKHLISFVRGYSRARGKWSDWGIIDDMSDAAIAKIIGDALSEDEAVARCSREVNQPISDDT